MSMTNRMSESPPTATTRGFPSVFDQGSTELMFPTRLARQLACLAEISYPFESCGLLIGRKLGNLNVVEQVSYVDSPGGISSGQQVPTFVAVAEANENIGPSGLEVIGIWRAVPCCSKSEPELSVDDVADGALYVTVSVPALGSARFRAWRRVGGILFEEAMK